MGLRTCSIMHGVLLVNSRHAHAIKLNSFPSCRQAVYVRMQLTQRRSLVSMVYEVKIKSIQAPIGYLVVFVLQIEWRHDHGIIKRVARLIDACLCKNVKLKS
jgi:hypothetical protein